MDQNKNAPAMSAEQDADLRRLEMMAADGEAPAVEAGQVDEVPAIDPAESWAMLPAMVGSVLSIALPELRQIYTPDTCRAWGDAMVPVADKYGWNADGLLGPEVGLLAASLPFIIGTASAIKSRRAAIEQEAKAPPAKPEASPPAAPDSQKTVTFGAPV